MKYILYATKEHGNGHVSEIGRFDDISEIQIRVGMFAPDVLIEVQIEDEEGDDDEY